MKGGCCLRMKHIDDRGEGADAVRGDNVDGWGMQEVAFQSQHLPILVPS